MVVVITYFTMLHVLHTNFMSKQNKNRKMYTEFFINVCKTFDEMSLHIGRTLMNGTCFFMDSATNRHKSLNYFLNNFYIH